MAALRQARGAAKLAGPLVLSSRQRCLPLRWLHGAPAGSGQRCRSAAGGADSDRQPLCATRAHSSNAVGAGVSSIAGSQAVTYDTSAGQLKPKPAKLSSTCNFCRVCGGSMQLAQPEGDSEWRHVCSACAYVDYVNPKSVVGCIVEHQGQILLCRRAIEPCRGLWTLPAGYQELGESSATGAARETWEEARAACTVEMPYAHLDIPMIGQSYLLFRARLAPPFTFSAGPETLEVALFRPADVPWDALAFSSISIALRLYCEDLARGTFMQHHGVIDKVRGSGPNDPTGFTLRDHMRIPTSVAVPSSMRA